MELIHVHLIWVVAKKIVRNLCGIFGNMRIIFGK